MKRTAEEVVELIRNWNHGKEPTGKDRDWDLYNFWLYAQGMISDVPVPAVVRVPGEEPWTRHPFSEDGEWLFANYPGQLPHVVRQAQERAGYTKPRATAPLQFCNADGTTMGEAPFSS